MSEEFVPKIVTEWIDRIQEATGYGSTVERINDRKWRLTTEGGRVRLTIDFVNPGSGKVRRRGSTLAVDGVQRELAEDFDHLVQIFKDPDGDGQSAEGSRSPESPEVLEMPPWRSPDEAPLAVRASYDSLVRAAGDAAEIGERDGRWMVGLRRDDRVIRLVFTRVKKMWGLDRLQLILDGVDRSQEARGDLAKALMLMNGESPSISGEKVIGTPSASARSNAVETRRATVIRN